MKSISVGDDNSPNPVRPALSNHDCNQNLVDLELLLDELWDMTYPYGI